MDMQLPFLQLIVSFTIFLLPQAANACSILYYVDKSTGKIYVVNSEDYWLDVEASLQIEPATKKEYARLWYGWDDFAQGGINDQGLFFDAAVTPQQQKVKGRHNPKNNLGNKLLAQCASVREALDFLEKEKIALDRSHLMLGDKTGQAVVVEWIAGERILHWITGNKLLMTNYLLAEPSAGNHPCYRYQSIENRIAEMEASGKEINLLKVGNTFGQAVQPARAAEGGRLGGTVYTTFIDLTDNQFVLSYKLSNENVVKLDLNQAFKERKRRMIRLED
jgi:penicillin V acylase-like amidase (Ntn superfamily)